MTPSIKVNGRVVPLLDDRLTVQKGLQGRKPVFPGRDTTLVGYTDDELQFLEFIERWKATYNNGQWPDMVQMLSLCESWLEAAI